jgi:hypothetical protein
VTAAEITHVVTGEEDNNNGDIPLEYYLKCMHIKVCHHTLKPETLLFQVLYILYLKELD